MPIRRLDKSSGSASTAKTGKGRQTSGPGGEKFAHYLDNVAAPQASNPLTALTGTAPIGGSEASLHQKREQLEQTDDLLGSLEDLGDNLKQGHESGENREQLRETRDQALRTLSSTPNKGEERDLLHRTAVLATVELAKSDRGDYN
ncbi:hypothetical protein ACQZV8_15865 [Magnetococcales bacterium HHB-1]